MKNLITSLILVLSTLSVTASAEGSYAVMQVTDGEVTSYTYAVATLRNCTVTARKLNVAYQGDFYHRCREISRSDYIDYPHRAILTIVHSSGPTNVLYYTDKDACVADRNALNETTPDLYLCESVL